MFKTCLIPKDGNIYPQPVICGNTVTCICGCSICNDCLKSKGRKPIMSRQKWNWHSRTDEVLDMPRKSKNYVDIPECRCNSNQCVECRKRIRREIFG